MTARHLAATVCFVAALGFLWVAALTPLRSADIAELDAEAQRLGEAWAASTADTADDESARLLRESNEVFLAARALEPPLAPLRALGLGVLAVAGGIALWPGPERPSQSTPAER